MRSSPGTELRSFSGTSRVRPRRSGDRADRGRVDRRGAVGRPVSGSRTRAPLSCGGVDVERTSPPAVRSASAADLPAVRRTLVSGFAEDPLYRWLYPDAVSRPSSMDEVFAFLLDAALPRNAVWVLDDLSAAAVWTPAGVDLVDAATATAYAALLDRQIGAERAELAVAGMAACAEHEPTEPHAVLHNIAVRRDRQGTGAGSVLLGSLLAAAAGDVLVHLDSSNPRNEPFYRRHGFEPVARTRVPGGGPVMTAMRRRPHGPPA